MTEKPYRLRLAISIIMLTIALLFFIRQITSMSVVQSLTYYKEFTSSLDYILYTDDTIMDTNTVLISGLGLQDFNIEQYEAIDIDDYYGKVEILDDDSIQTIYDTPPFLVDFEELNEDPYDSDFTMQHRIRVVVFILAVILSVVFIKNIDKIWQYTIEHAVWFSHSNLLLIASAAIVLRLAIPSCIFTAWDIVDTVQMTRGTRLSDFTHLSNSRNNIKVYSQLYDNGDEVIADFLEKELGLYDYKIDSKKKIRYRQYGYRDGDLRGQDINDVESTKIPYSSCRTAPVISFNKVDMAREWAVINYFDQLEGDKRDWSWDEFKCVKTIYE